MVNSSLAAQERAYNFRPRWHFAFLDPTTRLLRPELHRRAKDARNQKAAHRLRL